MRASATSADALFFAGAGGSAALMAAGYALDLAGLPMRGWVLAAVFVAVAASIIFSFRSHVTAARGIETLLFTIVVLGATGYLLYLAAPSFLPTPCPLIQT